MARATGFWKNSLQGSYFKLERKGKLRPCIGTGVPAVERNVNLGQGKVTFISPPKRFVLLLMIAFFFFISHFLAQLFVLLNRTIGG